MFQQLIIGAFLLIHFANAQGDFAPRATCGVVNYEYATILTKQKIIRSKSAARRMKAGAAGLAMAVVIGIIWVLSGW
ncbi:hypothetical protein BDZ45DRAFT_753783 [Acephala macrosclerotiorum]|nr:hypothetical protein BDZ45DRAFT_753783 [Acephala macrosclerotiorum]